MIKDLGDGYKISISETLHNGRCIAENGFNYEGHIRDWIRDHVSGKVFVDAGANYGIHTLNAVRYGASKVIAFECGKLAVGHLQDTIRLNGLTDKVELVNKAVTRAGRPAYIVECESDDNLRVWDEAMLGTHEVEAVSIMDYVKPGVDYIFKLDVEGKEMEILDDMMSYIVDNRPHIVLEVALGFYHDDTEVALRLDKLSLMCALEKRDVMFHVFDKGESQGIVTKDVGECIANVSEKSDRIADVELIF